LSVNHLNIHGSDQKDLSKNKTLRSKPADGSAATIVSPRVASYFVISVAISLSSYGHPLIYLSLLIQNLTKTLEKIMEV
jgi:hypothetical protein